MFKTIKYIRDFFHFYWSIVALQCVLVSAIQQSESVIHTYIHTHTHTYISPLSFSKGFLGGTVVKNLPANEGDAGDSDLIPGSRRSPGAGNGNPLWYSCLENPMDSGAWQATVHPQSLRVRHNWAHMQMRQYICQSHLPIHPIRLLSLVSTGLFSTSVSLFLFCK